MNDRLRRGYYNTVPLQDITTPFLEAVVSQLQVRENNAKLTLEGRK